MAIKVSTLLAHNTVVQNDLTPILGGNLNTDNFEIVNNGDPVVITGNSYPLGTGSAGQVLTTDGFGELSFQDAVSGPITLEGDVTGSGPSPVTTTLALSGVDLGTYGSSSSVGVFTVNAKGLITTASNSLISITPSQAGLGNVTNSLQVINDGGSPSIREGTGVPTGEDTLGAIYIDRAVTDGNGIFVYDGSEWIVVSTKYKLYSEKLNGYTTPVAAGLNSVALGSGAETAVSAPNSLSIGLQSVARIPFSVVQAGGRFSQSGDAQCGRYTLRGNTISAVPQELLVDGTGGSIRLVLPDNSTWTFKITVTGHRTDLGDGHAGYTATGVIYRGSGVDTTEIQGSVNKMVISESNPAWDINISADTVNGSLKIVATGESGKIIRWLALVETVEITN